MSTSDPAPEPTAPQPDTEPTAPPATTPTGIAPDPGAAAPAAPDGIPWRSWAIAAAVVAVLTGAAVFLLGRSGDDGVADTAAATATQGATTATVPGGGAGFAPGTRGTISAIDGGTITLETQSPDGTSGTTTVETTDETMITESVDASLADFEVGDDVVALGATDDGGTLTASSVSESDGTGFGQGPGGGVPEGFQPPADGELPEGFQPPADGQLPEGFEPPADGQLPEGFQPPQGGAAPGGRGAPTSGEITAITDEGLTIEAEDGTSVTVTVDGDTTFTVTEERSLDDLADGDTVLAVGDTGDDGVVTATSIRIGDGLVLGFGGPGGAPGVPTTTDSEGA